MTDCLLCNISPLIGEKIEAYLIGTPVPIKTHYLRINSINDTKGNKELFTPSARLLLSLNEQQEALNHRDIWINFLKSEAEYAIVFDSENINDKQLTIFIENKQIPKDWDIILISDTQYIFNKRAARILLTSCKQIHQQLKDYLKAFEVLKVLPLK